MSHFNINDLPQGSHVHFVGIGGISMSALALILKNLGYNISGSDMKTSNITDNLSKKDIPIYIGHASSNVAGADLVVYTAAIKQDNPEIINAKSLNIQTIERSTLLGEIMKKYKYSIGVSGTHGKTTTTSMISLILLSANYDPTIAVGGEVISIGGNLKLGNSEYFVTEACEYVESFLKFHPYIGIILNIDEDHLDYFKDIEHITNAFVSYAKLIPENGFLIINNDDSRAQRVINQSSCNIVSYGINSPSNFTARNIIFDLNGLPEFDVFMTNTHIGSIKLSIPGIHNVYNALAAIACAMSLGVNFEDCTNGLSNFVGVKRRFEIKGTFDKVTVIDDYAHHPTEVKATLSAALKYPHNKIWCIFQPHTYTRTKALLKEFSEAFYDVDKIIIIDIYAAREKDPGDIHSKDLVEKLKNNGKDAIYINNTEDVCKYILENSNENDVVITMGAGDVCKVGDMLLKK